MRTSTKAGGFLRADISGSHLLNGVCNDPKHGEWTFLIAVEVILQTYAANGAGNSLFPSTA